MSALCGCSPSKDKGGTAKTIGQIKNFLHIIFPVVKENTPYKDIDIFLNMLITAAQTNDFVNNTSKKLKPGPNGQTLFNRLKDCTLSELECAFNKTLTKNFRSIKNFLRNRHVVLAFDTTCEPFYGDLNNNAFWIHGYQPVRGSTGSFQYLTVSIVINEEKFILGAIPLTVGWYQADYVEKLIRLARKYVKIERCLFDRGFTSYELIHRLKKLRVGYQIFWRKDKKRETWLTKELKSMKKRDLKEVYHTGEFSADFSIYKVKTRFVIIKEYQWKDEEKAYDWVFATNCKFKIKSNYLKSYKRRWGIETSYRVLDEIRIRTTTHDHVKRYFLFVFCCLLYNLWKFYNKTHKLRVTFGLFVYVMFKLISERIVIKNKEPPKEIMQLKKWLLNNS